MAWCGYMYSPLSTTVYLVVGFQEYIDSCHISRIATPKVGKEGPRD